jgi:LPS sulfotransferase NodH
MHFEVFNDKAIYMYERRGSPKGSGTVRDIASLRARDKDPSAFLKRIVDGESENIVGFKLFPEHMNRSEQLHEFFERVLSDPRIRKVVLRRENHLDVCVSAMRAACTGEYLNKNLDDVQVHIKPQDFENYVYSYDSYYEFLQERLAGQQYVDITYEQLVSSPEEALLPVYKLLSASPSGGSAPASDIVQQSTTTRDRKVLNFEALRAAFLATDRAGDFE